MDQRRQLLLERLDALLDDDVRLELADSLFIKVEAVWNRIVVESLALLRGVLELRVLALGPTFASG